MTGRISTSSDTTIVSRSMAIMVGTSIIDRTSEFITRLRCSATPSVLSGSVIFEHAPNPAAGRRTPALTPVWWGSDTLQVTNHDRKYTGISFRLMELRRSWRQGVNGGCRAGRSLGIESNYNKDQMNDHGLTGLFFALYTWVRATIRSTINSLSITGQNGNQQSEPFNSFRI